MPTVTVAGSGSGAITYNSSDAVGAANVAAAAIAKSIAAGSTVTPYAGGSSVTSSGNTVAVFSTTAPVGPVSLDGGIVGVIDSLSTVVSLAGGAQGVSVVAGSGGLVFTNVTASGTLTDNIVAGDGSNIIGTAATGGGNYLVNTGSGNDLIQINTGKATVNAGSGTNYINLGSSNTLVLSQGYDSVTGSGVSVAGGSGIDTINIGSGSTSVNPGFSNFYIFGNNLHSLFVSAGAGTDTISVGAGGGYVIGGTGLTNAANNGATTNLVSNNILIAGSGGGTFGSTTLQGAGGSDRLYAGSGNDTLIAGAGSETLFGSSGTAAMYSGSGPTTFQFTAAGIVGAATIPGGNGSTPALVGGGFDIIANFKANDVLSTVGYGPNAALSATVSNGSTTITLVDGTTIQLAGVSNLKLSQVSSV